jgi:hypothetical protein
MAARSVAEGSARYVPVVFSTWRGDSKADLIAALEAAVRPLLRGRAQLTLRRETLGGAIEDVVAAVDATPLVILDQFEERVLYEVDDEFDDELAHCITRRDLRANFLISVREDAYSLIGARFKSRIANVYGNYLHLDYLDARAARDAVLEPVEACNRRLPADAPRFEVEPALVDAVLEQVRRGRVNLGDRGRSYVKHGVEIGVSMRSAARLGAASGGACRSFQMRLARWRLRQRSASVRVFPGSPLDLWVNPASARLLDQGRLCRP